MYKPFRMLHISQDGGQYLVAVDDANEHIISLWDWQKGEKGHKITETKVSSWSPLLSMYISDSFACW